MNKKLETDPFIPLIEAVEANTSGKHEDRILAEADRLFSQFGIKNVTMDDISRNLGISKKTIYLNFANKDDLVMQWAVQLIHTLEKQMELGMATASNAIEEVFIAINQNKEQINKMNPLIFHDLIKYHPKCLSFVKEHRSNEEKNSIINLINRGIKEGLFMDDLNIEILASYHVHMKDICMNNEVFPHTMFHIFNVMREMRLNFLTGISTIKGHNLINQYKETKKQNNSKNEFEND